MALQVADVLGQVARIAESSGRFGAVRVEGGVLKCAALESAEPADYRITPDDQAVFWVELVTEDRWLSGSIEGELVHSGDKINELVDEELADLGWEGDPSSFEHFRSEDMLYTFRSRIPTSDPDGIARWLLAYELVFGELGDMAGGDDD
ncbi:MAG: hypothetical protein AAGA55_06740 [Planctomycetota bacterium]